LTRAQAVLVCGTPGRFAVPGFTVCGLNLRASFTPVLPLPADAIENLPHVLSELRRFRAGISKVHKIDLRFTRQTLERDPLRVLLQEPA
jgi:hypothetical protein